mgnify:CR=1 FL=1
MSAHREKGPSITLLRGDQVAAEAMDWLWPDFLARGKVHLLAGAPGVGKTLLAKALAGELGVERLDAAGEVGGGGFRVLTCSISPPASCGSAATRSPSPSSWGPPTICATSCACLIPRR